MELDANTPEAVSKIFEDLLRKGDLDGVAGLYEDGAVFADLSGAVTGVEKILAAHRLFLDSGLSLTLNETVTLQADDIALVHWSWTVHQSDGSAMEGVSAEVMRRQPDDTWKFVIDNSDGSAVVGLL